MLWVALILVIVIARVMPSILLLVFGFLFSAHCLLCIFNRRYEKAIYRIGGGTILTSKNNTFFRHYYDVRGLIAGIAMLVTFWFIYSH